MARVAKKYGISKQRIYQILLRARGLGVVVNRPRLLARHHRIDRCEICGKILQVAEKDNFITKRQLSQMLGIEHEVCSWHLNQLKVSGFVSKKFATMRSDRLAKALLYYKYSSFSPSVVGRKFGYKNFYSLISYQKKRGMEIERKRALNLPMPGVLEVEDRIPEIHP